MTTPRDYSTLLSRRRHIASPPLLRQHGFESLLSSSEDGAFVGLQTSSRILQLTTLQGPMAAEAWVDTHTQEAEDLAQPTVLVDNNSDDNNTNGRPRRRRLNLPEIVFPQALVKVQLKRPRDGDNNMLLTSLEWTVEEPLREWAKAHQHLSLPVDSGEHENNNMANVAYRGVSILQSVDAALWATKHKSTGKLGTDSSGDVSTAAATTTDFHYDWTYSTPFTVALLNQLNGTSTVTSTINADEHEGCSGGAAAFTWIPLQKSGMDMSLLQDRTQPILYFDEIVLWEDDLHDNGESQLSIKVRVMPFGMFVLSRLVVRVDGVRVRVRDTRVLIMLRDEGTASELEDVSPGMPKVYRDVVWREASWSDLATMGLPTSLREWTVPAAAAALFGRLPEVGLPPDIIKHAILKEGPAAER